MHWLSKHNFNEFLTTIGQIKFDYSHNEDNNCEPSLLISGNTLLLKYIIQNAPMKLVFTMYNNKLLYALKIQDDDNTGCILWSIAEREEEFNAILGWIKHEPSFIYLFNEIALNVADNDLPLPHNLKQLTEWIEDAERGKFNYQDNENYIHNSLLPPIYDNTEDNSWLTFEINIKKDWRPINNYLFTNNNTTSLINIFEANEGNQQEQICIWLTDNLQPSLGAYHSPQIFESKRHRELTDILLSYENGTMLIESKTLSIFSRASLPNRTQLKKDIVSHIQKAIKQLQGAIKKIKSNITITNITDQKEICIERTQPIHAIILIPDITLLDDNDSLTILKLMNNFIDKTDSYIQLFDISELLKSLQSINIVVKNNNTVNHMMAFNWYLIERFTAIAKEGNLQTKFRLQFS